MKENIHPEYVECKVTCSCGNSFKTRSTYGQEMKVETCSECHPFYTGQQRVLDSEGRIEKFKRKYGSYKKDREEKKKKAAEKKKQNQENQKNQKKQEEPNEDKK